MKQSLILTTALVLILYGNVSSELTVLDNRIRLSWTYTTTNITFTLVANTTGWAAIGFSPHGGMEGADIVMIMAQNGNITIQDRHATGTSLPTLDMQQDYKLQSGSVANGQLRATFYRLIDTCDPSDTIIKSFTTKIIVAYGAVDDSGNPQYHGSGQRASTSRYLLSSEPGKSSDSGIFNIDPVPLNISIRNDSDTIYWCSIVQLPQLEKKVHIVEIAPVITPGNEDIVHHMLVYMCDGPVNTNISSFDCFNEADLGNQNSCRTLIGTWAVGGTIIRFPSNVGLPLDYGNSSKYILIQTHYNNMGGFSGRVDASYLRFVATQSLRPIDAGILQTGVINGMLIPPNVDQTLVSGYCPSECLSSTVLPPSGINIFAVALHSHLLGRRITLRHFRPTENSTLSVIADDPSYDFEFQETIYLDSPRVILPGDVLQTVCVMNSSDRNVATQGGFGTMQEMCLSFIFYYPKVSINLCQTSPAWIFSQNDTMYQLLGKNYSSFNWNNGVNDGLAGANWSLTLIQTLHKGYSADVNGFFCQFNGTGFSNITQPPTSASSTLPVYPAVSQQCQLNAASLISILMTNSSTSTTTARSTGGIGVKGYSSARVLAALCIVATFAVTVL